jgi:SWI/SNF-related matrix-associated actin-dependent regulator of chromatin subfamily A3
VSGILAPLNPDCFPCIDEWLHRDAVCPFCRHALTLASLLPLPADESEYVEPTQNPVAPVTRSAKIEELVKYLKVFDINDKTLVFSQFTSFLDIVSGALNQEGIQFCRFDGSMNAKQVGNSPRITEV